MHFVKLTSDQVAQLLAERVAGVRLRVLAKRYGVSVQIIWKWMHYRGLDARWLVHVKTMEKQVVRLQAEIARTRQQVKVGAQVIRRLEPNPHRRSLFATAVGVSHGMCRSRANAMLGLSQAAGKQRTIKVKDDQLIYEMRRYFDSNPGVGFSSMFQVLLQDAGCTRHHALNLYQRERMELKHRPLRPLLPKRIHKAVALPGAPDLMWSLDFMLDALKDGKRFRVLNCIDDYNRECVFAVAMWKTSTKPIVDALTACAAAGRTPAAVRSDNGIEFRGLRYVGWCKANGVKLNYIRPGHPEENVFAERFNGTLRREIFNWYDFDSLATVQRALDDWCVRYNWSRPHRGLGGLSPVQYKQLGREREGRARCAGSAGVHV